jgi:TonB family protein
MFWNWIMIWLYLPAFFYADQPEFKGGPRSLSAFITNSIIYPEYARQNCLQGTIQISFKLNRKGIVWDSKVERGFGIDLDKEALRIVRLTSGKWIVPASHDTTVSLILPINFSLTEGKCDPRTRDNISQAISAYKTQQNLTSVIVNFYANKRSGTYRVEDEQRVLSLKTELGYDDRYLDRLIRQGQTKLKQGDKESACDDFNLVYGLGSDKADKLISQTCH